ncbi:ATP-dependent RNA helicase dbp7 [Kappamyces sp. JEL0680]|nr:ATP-dependent RNA helicase dbp7 [Kappamyces sp. JEL0680]
MDSGILLNFAVEDTTKDTGRIPISRVVGSIKKGSWSQKLREAKKIIEHASSLSGRSLATGRGSDGAGNSQPSQQPFKRRAQIKPVEGVGQPQKESQKPGFTSSIFTANPTAVSKKPAARPAKEPADIRKSSHVFSDATFSGLGVHPVLSGHLAKLKIHTPTDIQKLSIPKLMDTTDRDFIIQAQTGSGKTFSFLLPILNRLIVASAELETKVGSGFFSRSSGVFAIILAPTRELAQQIAAVLETLLRYTRNAAEAQEKQDTYCRHWIVSGLITGGESKKSEKSRLRKGINILVATPGRLLDHLKTTESFEVGNLRWLVLDEADNLLHLGFEETLQEILLILNEKGMKAVENKSRLRLPGWPFERQTLLCSATIEGGVEKLAQTSLRNPFFLKAGNVTKDEAVATLPGSQNPGKGDVIAIPQQLKQHYVLSPAKLRLVNLVGLLRKVGAGL